MPYPRDIFCTLIIVPTNLPVCLRCLVASLSHDCACRVLYPCKQLYFCTLARIQISAYCKIGTSLVVGVSQAQTFGIFCRPTLMGQCRHLGICNSVPHSLLPMLTLQGLPPFQIHPMTRAAMGAAMAWAPQRMNSSKLAPPLPAALGFTATQTSSAKLTKAGGCGCACACATDTSMCA
jgi:hypothetical protein